MIIDTPRTRLRCWRESDRDAFAALHAHPEVMSDLGGPLDRTQSEEGVRPVQPHALGSGKSRPLP